MTAGRRPPLVEVFPDLFVDIITLLCAADEDGPLADTVSDLLFLRHVHLSYRHRRGRARFLDPMWTAVS
ncbi:hypothetical protein [Streptosporangium sp. NPDC020145]|uniref:hypothetical protein n=1 Tax=Streptosporangium sp. NPDC020145 TaxID=3154694 RepID=UPI0034308316